MIELVVKVPCEKQTHTVRVRLDTWTQWTVVSTECMERLGPVLGKMFPCYKLVQGRDQDVRFKVVGLLKELWAVPLLIEALTDEDWHVRALAAQSLGHCGAPDAVPALIDRLLHDEDTWVRQAAATSLGWIGDRTAVPALLRALREDEDVLTEAARALGDIGDPVAVPALRKVQKHPDFWVQMVVEEALRKILRRSQCTK